MRLKSLAVGLLLALVASSAFAQCSGNPPAGRLCANGTSAATLPSWYTQSVVLDRNFGAPSVQGTMLNRGASLWSATATPSLGLNGGTGGSITLNGSSTGSAIIGVKAAAGSTTFNLPVGNGSLNNVLATDGSGNTSWASLAGVGTVTSVGLALPASILTVSGSPVTTTGTLTGTLATQSANIVWAGPTTGAAATPTFRSLVGADLPNPAASTLGGVESFAAVSSQWIRQISTSGVPTASQPAFTDISGTLQAGQFPTLTGDVTTSGGSLATTIAANAVTNAKAAQMTADTVKCNPTGSTANAQDCTSPVVSGAVTSTINNTGSSPLGSFIASSPNVSYFWNVTGNPADQKNWDAAASGSVLLFRAVNDANTVANPWMTVTRGTGATVANVTFPNTVIGTANSGGSTGAFLASAASPAYGWQATGQSADQKVWDAIVSGTTLNFRAVNDAGNSATAWMTVQRGAAAAITGVLIPTSLSVSPTGSSLNQAISTAQTGSGTNTGSSVNLNLMNITSDNINAGGNFVDGILIQQFSGGAAAQGGRQTVFAALFINATTSASSTNRNYVAGAFETQASVNDNGTISVAAGSVFGLNPVANLTFGATFYANISAVEANVAVASGASVAYKSGIQIADGATDAVQGTTFDCELCLSNQTTTGWKDGILFGAMNSQHPVAAAGTLIATTGSFTVTNGIDFSSYTFSSSAFKSTAFSVSGTGAVSGLSYTANGSAGVNCSGSPTGSFASVAGIVTHC